MSNVQAILQQLPPYKGDQRLISSRQDTFDIIRQILSNHRNTAAHYDKIAINHWKGDAERSARELYDFLKQNAPYKVEPVKKQTTKTPAAILQEARTYGNDCKHYANYSVGVGEALARLGYPVKCFYRFASYKNGSRAPGHVFGVWVINGKEYWIDPVPEIHGFNARNIVPSYKIDKIPPMSRYKTIGSLYHISGISNGDYVAGPAPYAGRGHWLDDMPGSTMGKAKKNKPPKKKGPGIVKKIAKKVQNTGKSIKKGVKKIVPKKGTKIVAKYTLATSRGAFLTLVKLNAFNLGVKMWLHAAKDKNSKGWKELSAKWIKLGGKPDSLYKNIQQGVGTHNKLHPKKKVSGFDDYMDGIDYDNVAGIGGYDDDMTIGQICGFVHNREVHNAIGVAPAVASAGVIAAAAPIMTALANLLKAFGVNTKKADDTAAADMEDLADKHNNEGGDYTDEEGTTKHNDGTETEAITKADGSTELIVKNLPGVKTTEYTPGKNTDKPYSEQEEEAEEAEEVDDEGNVITKTKTITKTKKKKGGSGLSFSDMVNNVTGFVSEHKTWFIVGGAVVGAALILPPLVRRMRSKPTRRRK